MFCIMCGKQMNDDAKFCTNCGAKLENTESKNVMKKSNARTRKIRWIVIGATVLVCVCVTIIVYNEFFKGYIKKNGITYKYYPDGTASVEYHECSYMTVDEEILEKDYINIVIPNTVKRFGKKYSVTSIGDYAFKR